MLSQAPRSSPAFQSLFSSHVNVYELRGAGNPLELLPDELDAIRGAGPKRAMDFAAGRQCARIALEAAGVRHFALRASHDRCPIWPSGFCGSISHTHGLCLVAVAKLDDKISLGIDCEVMGSVESDVWPDVFVESELQWIYTLPVSERETAATMLFSGKEAFYKFQYSMTGEWIDFREVVISTTDWSKKTGHLKICAKRQILLSNHLQKLLEARFVIDNPFVATSVSCDSPRHNVDQTSKR